MGHASRQRPSDRLVWMHAVSVGESLSLLPLIESARAKRPDVTILVTTGTRAAAQLLETRVPPDVIHQFAPIDVPAAVGRFLDHWRPDVGVFVESELWPNLILGAHSRGVRLALVSARMSERSFVGWRRVRDAAASVLGDFDLVLARDDISAERFRSLGARVDGVADLKFGAAPLPADASALAALAGAIGGRPTIVAASTHPGEEDLLLARFAVVGRAIDKPSLLILAPRHVDRGAQIEAQAVEHDFVTARRSAKADPSQAQVFVADTLGEMGLWYRLANLAIMGGSFISGIGGHNPLEPARLSCPFVAGVHIDAWPVYKEIVAANGSAFIHRPDDLDRYLRTALCDPAALSQMGRRAQRFVELRDLETHNSTDLVLELLAP